MDVRAFWYRYSITFWAPRQQRIADRPQNTARLPNARNSCVCVFWESVTIPLPNMPQEPQELNKPRVTSWRWHRGTPEVRFGELFRDHLQVVQ